MKKLFFSLVLSIMAICVANAQEVTVKAQDRYGNEYVITGVDLLAKALCHEIDHLEGVLFIDKIIKDYKERKKKGA